MYVFSCFGTAGYKILNDDRSMFDSEYNNQRTLNTRIYTTQKKFEKMENTKKQNLKQLIDLVKNKNGEQYDLQAYL